MRKAIVVSVVSHGHGRMIEQLLRDIAAHCVAESLHIELTLNVNERLSIDPGTLPFSISLHWNVQPQGFAANHNAAFRRTQGDYFCVMNPDVRLRADPFPVLVSRVDQEIGLVAPQVVNSAGMIQNSARAFPTPWTILAKAMRREERIAYDVSRNDAHPDWVAGICMLIPWHVYQRIGGFDERYRLYYEDVDLCARLRLCGYGILVVPEAVIIHDGAYSSHRRLKYLVWHLRSMLRFFGSGVFRAALQSRRALTRGGGDGKRRIQDKPR
jgi:N-acetylglucosaminyl-diphospho-decaprenol L-rhamnosyltransferase